MGGMFIVVEGPNGVGKSTAVRLLAKRLRRYGSVHETTEVTHTPFGMMVREQEEWLAGRALALAIAADRCAHIEQEIQPRLYEGTHVISDRYLPSSLVLQRIDGVALEEIWAYNQHAPAPNLTVYLEDSPEVIADRLARRERLSRLEKIGSPEKELALYREAHAFLAGKGWQQRVFQCQGYPAETVAQGIYDQILIQM